jgi:hypothetical protein
VAVGSYRRFSLCFFLQEEQRLVENANKLLAGLPVTVRLRHSLLPLGYKDTQENIRAGL